MDVEEAFWVLQLTCTEPVYSPLVAVIVSNELEEVMFPVFVSEFKV
jgi:hypothetical protein